MSGIEVDAGTNLPVGRRMDGTETVEISDLVSGAVLSRMQRYHPAREGRPEELFREIRSMMEARLALTISMEFGDEPQDYVAVQHLSRMK